MPEIRTVTTLVKKRDKIRASIKMYEAKIAQARSDLSQVTAVPRGRRPVSSAQINRLLAHAPPG
jgi:hypothetical protein